MKTHDQPCGWWLFFFFLSQLRFYFLRNWQEKHKRTQQPRLFPVLDVIFRASDEEIEEADTGGEGNQELGFKIGLRCHDRKGGEDSRRSGCLIENSGGGGGIYGASRENSWQEILHLVFSGTNKTMFHFKTAAAKTSAVCSTQVLNVQNTLCPNETLHTVVVVGVLVLWPQCTWHL